MKKVAYYSFFKEDASSFYRVHAVIPYLKSKDYQLVCMSGQTHIDWSSLVEIDILILQRPCDGQHLNLIKLAKDMSVKVILDYDDDCLHLDMYNPMFGHYQHHKANIIECLTLADEIWVSTDGVKKSYHLYNKNIHIIPNCHNDYVFPIDKKMPFNRDSNVAMYRGGGSHEGDIYESGVTESIINIVNSNKAWNFKFFGARFIFLEMRCGENYYSVEGSTTIQFYKKMHRENAAIFFYPLTNHRFNQGKSNIAWQESTYSGSAFFGNKNLKEFNKDCMIDLDLLPEALSNNMATDLLERANEESWEYIKEHLLLSNVNKLRHERILANL